MSDTATRSVKAPWHLWVVGIVAVLWNSMGVLDFSMTQWNSEAWLKSFTPEQVAYIRQFPLWAVICWGAGVYGGFIGSILLLARKTWAVPVFLVSLFGAIMTSVYSHLVTNSSQAMGTGAGAAVFSAVIVAIAALLLWYSFAMCRRGALR